jgi:hypothetical protein
MAIDQQELVESMVDMLQDLDTEWLILLGSAVMMEAERRREKLKEEAESVKLVRVK